VSEWSAVGAAYATVIEVTLASVLIVQACSHMVDDVMQWADTIIAQTQDYKSADPTAQGPWASPPSWATSDKGLLSKVKKWLFEGASKKQGFLAPVVAVMGDNYDTCLTSQFIFKWTRRLCAATTSKEPKPFLVPDCDRKLRRLHMLPALARYLKGNFNTIETQLQLQEDQLNQVWL